jgi:hypothetical protein
VRLGRRQATATTDLVVGSPERAEDASVVALRSVDQLRVCPECSVVNGALDSYCTACGTELAVASAGDSEPTQVTPGRDNDAATVDLAAEQTRSADEVRRPVVVHPPISARTFVQRPSDARSWKLRTALVASIVLGLAGTATFGWLWNSEKTHRQRVVAQRDAAQTSLNATQKRLATTLASLRATSALANQRKAVLLRAQTVLAKVDPLLSDADHIKQVASDIQSVRDTFASDSSQMTSDLIYLENYEANPQNYPGVDQYGLVAQVDNELATVRSDYAVLTASDGSFSDASTTFGNHATAFTEAVRKLQAELQRATSK